MSIVLVGLNHRTAPVGLRRTVDEYLEYLHSTSTLARARLGDRAAAFDAEIRAVRSGNGGNVIALCWQLTGSLRHSRTGDLARGCHPLHVQPARSVRRC